MNWLDYYQKMKYEVDILEVRLKMIKQYEKNLEEERSKIETIVYLQKELLNQISHDLETYHGIEYKLFNEIMVNGLSVTRAIEKVAHEEEKDESTLWKYYYPKVKKKITELQAIMLEVN